MKIRLIGLIFIIISVLVKSQNTDSTKRFKVSLNFRPRVEFRNGYKQLPNDTTMPAYSGSKRSRILVDFKQENFKFHTSLQDVSVWGQYGQLSITGSFNSACRKKYGNIERREL